MQYINTSKNKNIQGPLERFGSGREIVSQKVLDSMILKFIIEETQPLRLVDRPSFINLVRLGLPKQLSIMCSKTLKYKIAFMFNEMKNNLINTLSTISWVSTTADCWTQGKRSFIGITCHWIDIKTLQRRSATLACSRMKGKHTYDLIAKKIYSIHQDYKITNKVLSCTTDNGTNFVKAFVEFNKELESEDEEDVICHIDLCTILNEKNAVNEENDYLEVGIQLPLHRRCASHTINLIATTDIDKVLNSLDKKKVYTQNEKHLQQFTKMYRKVFAKIQKLWNKQNQSDILAERVHEEFSVYLKSPSQTRWNGLYDGIKQINDLLRVHQGLNKFNSVLDFCTLPRFELQEVNFIQEYVEIMKPLADSLDFLQGEESVYMGFLLPTLYALEKKYNKLKNKTFTICSPIIDPIISSIKKRLEIIISLQ